MKKTQPVRRKLKKTDTADSRKHKRADSRRCRRVAARILKAASDTIDWYNREAEKTWGGRWPENEAEMEAAKTKEWILQRLPLLDPKRFLDLFSWTTYYEVKTTGVRLQRFLDLFRSEKPYIEAKSIQLS